MRFFRTQLFRRLAVAEISAQRAPQLLSLLFLACALLLQIWASAAAADAGFNASVAKLTEKSFQVKEAAIGEIALSGSNQAISLLVALQDGKLFYRKKDKRIAYVKSVDKGYDLTDALTGEDLGFVKKRKAKKVTINNNLRSILKAALGSLQLSSPDTEVRLAAANDLLNNPTAAAQPMIARARAEETDDEIKMLLELSMAVLDAQTGPVGQRIAAVGVLSGSMNPRVWQVLGELVAQGEQENVTADQKSIATVAAEALKSIEGQKKFYDLLETIFFGLSLGAVLFLASVGLAITFGVMGVINMAHGEMLMIGAYTTFVVQQMMPSSIEYSLFVAIPLAFVVCGLIGIAIERTVIQSLYGRPLETLLATFGVSLFLQQAIRSIFSPLNQPVITPEWMSGFYEVNGALSLTYNRLYIIAFCLVVFAGLLLVLRKTSLGLQIRAVTQNRAMASSMGIRTGWVDALTFGLGSGIAGVGGVAISLLTNVGPNLGQGYIIDSFMVVVFGGVGNLWGTLVGATILGMANKFMEPMTGAVIAKILVLVFIILFIQRRPKGLFALKGRAVEA